MPQRWEDNNEPSSDPRRYHFDPEQNEAPAAKEPTKPWLDFRGWGRHLLSDLAWHGLLTMVVPVATLVSLVGVDLRILLLWVIPPVMAAIYAQFSNKHSERIAAWTFLALLGLGSLLAHVPSIFPKLGGFAKGYGISLWQDRMLCWYTSLYVIFLFYFLPPWLCIGALLDHRAGRPAICSRFTCWLALTWSTLMLIGLPMIIEGLGLWPVY